MSLPKNTAQTVTLTLLDADGHGVVGAILETTCSKDSGAFVATANNAAEVTDGVGQYSLALTDTERNCDELVILGTDGTYGTRTKQYPGQDVLTLLGALHDFDPETDAVAHVVLTDIVTTLTEDVAAQVDNSAVADAIRTELATELGRIDAAITTRSTFAAGENVVATNMRGTDGAYTGTPPSADTIATAVEGHLLSETDGEAVLAAIVAAINATDVDLAGLSTATIATSVRNSLATELSRIDATISSRNAVTPSTPEDVTTAQDAITTAITNKAVTPATDLSATNAALAALHDFDPAADVVGHVTLVDTATDLTNAPSIPDGVALTTDVTNAEGNILDAIAAGDITSGTEFTEASKDSNGDVIGITTPGATIRAYAVSDTELVTAIRRTTANANGTWSIFVEPDADYILAFTKDGYYDAEGNDSVLTKVVTA